MTSSADSDSEEEEEQETKKKKDKKKRKSSTEGGASKPKKAKVYNINSVKYIDAKAFCVESKYRMFLFVRLPISLFFAFITLVH